ncbi:MAG: cyclic nucleotide-binding domain-containing protein [Mariprofundaceae bacterium]|nr:cyclic nucleotide-binding domain-containing protein [Mariprofundaceae bacterium]
MIEPCVKQHVGGKLQHDHKFLFKLLVSGVLTACGFHELDLNLELSFVAVVFVPAIGLFCTYGKLELNPKLIRMLSIIIFALIFGLLTASIFLGLACLIILEGTTHPSCVVRYQPVKWMKGAETEATVSSLSKLLKNHTLFKDVSKESCATMEEHCKTLELQAGAVLIREGEFNHYLYLLCLGTANVEHGGEHRATLNEGDIFGEISAIGLSLPVASVIAASDVLAFAFPISVINEAAKECPAFLETLHEMGMGRMEG